MGFRDDMIELADDLRRQLVVEAFELRLDSVVVRVQAYTGSEIGRGDPYTVSDLVLDPVPKVSRPSPRLQAAAPGKYLDGDVLVSKISATYTEAQLGMGPQERGREAIWLINDLPYTLVSLDKHYIEWKAHLRKKRD